MKSFWRAVCSVTCLVAFATLLQCCGGSKQNTSLLTITSASLPNGTVEVQYNEQVKATGGVAPYRWSVSKGAPPNNILLSNSNTATDTISGTPDTPAQGVAFSIRVTDSANQSATQAYTISITGLADTLSLSPASLVFSPQLNGTASTTQTATLSNSGTSTVAINSIASTGSNAADFGESNNCGSSFAPGASCQINVSFNPGQAGPRVASITINDDTNGTPHQLGLNGTGLSPGPNATLSANTLTFAGQQVNTTSPSQAITLTNYGTAALSITGIATTETFAQTNTCPSSLASAASCPINVAFSPVASGTATGTLSVTANSSGGPQTVTLNGTGAATGTPVLNGLCGGPDAGGTACGAADDLAECPAGVAATSPAEVACGVTNSMSIDNSRTCSAVNSHTGRVTGWCATGLAASSRIVSRKSCNQ